MTNKVIWCDRGWQHVYYGFCPSEKAWRREMRWIARECKDPDSAKAMVAEPYPEGQNGKQARVTTFSHNGGAKIICLLTVSAEVDRAGILDVAPLITHEACHVWQQVRKDMGEDNPSVEFEAHAVQAITMNLLMAYRDARGPKCLGPHKTRSATPKRLARRRKSGSGRRSRTKS